MLTMRTGIGILLLVQSGLFLGVHAGCKTSDASFFENKAPTVTQPSKTDATKVMVNWARIINNPKCVDVFTLWVYPKGMTKLQGQKYEITGKPIPPTSKVVEVEPCVTYMFELEYLEKEVLFSDDKGTAKIAEFNTGAKALLINKDKDKFQVGYVFDKINNVLDFSKAAIRFPKELIKNPSCISYVEVEGRQVTRPTLDAHASGAKGARMSTAGFGRSRGNHRGSIQGSSGSNSGRYDPHSGSGSGGYNPSYPGSTGGNGYYPGSSYPGHSGGYNPGSSYPGHSGGYNPGSTGGSGSYPGSSSTGGSGSYPGYPSSSSTGGSGSYPGYPSSSTGGSGSYPGYPSSSSTGGSGSYPSGGYRSSYPGHHSTSGGGYRSTGFAEDGDDFAMGRSRRSARRPSNAGKPTTTSRPTLGTTGSVVKGKATPPYYGDIIEVPIDITPCKDYDFKLKIIGSGSSVMAEVADLRLPSLTELWHYKAPPLHSVLKVQLVNRQNLPNLIVDPKYGVPEECVNDLFMYADNRMSRLENDLNYQLAERERLIDNAKKLKEQIEQRRESQLKFQFGCKCDSMTVNLNSTEAKAHKKYGPALGYYRYAGEQNERPYYLKVDGPLVPAGSASGRPNYSTTTTTTPKPGKKGAVKKVYHLYWDKERLGWAVGLKMDGDDVIMRTEKKNQAKCPADPEAAKKWEYSGTLSWHSDASMKAECA